MYYCTGIAYSGPLTQAHQMEFAGECLPELYEPTPTQPAKKQKVSNSSCKEVKYDTLAFLGRGSSNDEAATPSEQPKPKKTEWRLYAEVAQIDAKEDLLEWWKTNESQFPSVAKMAQQVHGCPASSAGVERLFSKASRALSKLRKSINNLTLSDILMSENLDYLLNV